MRTLVIGDIHGGLKALQQLLKRMKIRPYDFLIFLGDYVDGWSESAQVLDYLIALDKTHECIFIKGNHDVYCENWLQKNETPDTWLFHGGSLTIKSYEKHSEEQKQTHLDFLKKMKLYHVDKSNRLFIHAGFTSMHGPYKEVYESNYNWDRTLWETALSMDKKLDKESVFYPKRLKLFHEIYIGHTPTTNYGFDTPMNGCNVWNIDTGAAFKGKLSAMDIDSKEVFQSDVVQSLYSDENGRNKN